MWEARHNAGNGRHPAVFQPTRPASRDHAKPDEGPSDDLLDQLDAIVVGSQWGRPQSSPSQAHDRALAREFDYQVQEAEVRYKP